MRLEGHDWPGGKQARIPAPDVSVSGLTDPELVVRFESLGQNCEFGFVQRLAGAEPLGLLRFAGMPFERLIDALETEFANLDARDPVEIELCDGEYRVRVRGLGLGYHTHLQENEISLDQLLKVERRKVRFLAWQLLDDLRGGRKIFVYRPHSGGRPGDLEVLVSTLSRFGAPLLWVDAPDGDDIASTVECVAPGVMRGYALLPPVAVHEPHMGSWLSVCREALRIRQSPQALHARARSAPHFRIEFGARGDASSHTREGWSHPEEAFTWAEGKRSRLVLPCPDADEALLSLLVVPFVHPPERPAQPLEVTVNGQVVGSYSLQGQAQLQCVIPREALARGGTLDILFDHPGAVAPAAFADGNGDTRELAIMFHSVAIHGL